jgi:hypothetical protein
MSEAVTAVRTRGVSPRFLARTIGVFYLLTILLGMFAQGYVSNRLIVWDDAAATATNIMNHRGLFQWGLTVYLIEMSFSVVTTALLFFLLEPAGRTLSMVTAFIGLTACTIKTVGRVFFAAPLFVLGGVPALSALHPETLNALALLLLKVNDHAAGIAMVFFGAYAILAGLLILRSTFLPRVLGILGIVAGLGWLTYLSPPIGYRLFPYVIGVALLGSAAKIFWLLVFGVNEQRWHEQAGPAR